MRQHDRSRRIEAAARGCNTHARSPEPVQLTLECTGRIDHEQLAGGDYSDRRGQALERSVSSSCFAIAAEAARVGKSTILSRAEDDQLCRATQDVTPASKRSLK